MTLNKILEDRVYSLGILLIFTAVATSFIFADTFPTFENFSQILLNLSIDTIVAVGMMLLLISGAFDLSVGSIVAFTGCLAAYLMHFLQVPVPIALILALLSALLIGLINGYLIAYQNINPMIQTLAMMGIVRGCALLVSGAGIQNLPYWFNAIGQSKLLGIQMPIWYMLITVGIFTFLFNKTIFFRRYYYIGGNEKAADLSGIRVKKMKMICVYHFRHARWLRRYFIIVAIRRGVAHHGPWPGITCYYSGDSRWRYVKWRLWENTRRFVRRIVYGFDFQYHGDCASVRVLAGNNSGAHFNQYTVAR